MSVVKISPYEKELGLAINKLRSLTAKQGPLAARSESTIALMTRNKKGCRTIKRKVTKSEMRSSPADLGVNRVNRERYEELYRNYSNPRFLASVPIKKRLTKERQEAATPKQQAKNEDVSEKAVEMARRKYEGRPINGKMQRSGDNDQVARRNVERRNAVKRKIREAPSSANLSSTQRIANPLGEEELNEFRSLLVEYFGSRRKALLFIDDNNSGEISRSEFEIAISTLITRSSHPGGLRALQRKSVLQDMDDESSVYVRFAEFLKQAANGAYYTDRLFKTLDADGSGSISADELLPLPPPEPLFKEWNLLNTDEKWNRYLGESVQMPDRLLSGDEEVGGSHPLQSLLSTRLLVHSRDPLWAEAVARDRESRLGRLLKLEREKHFMRMNKPALYSYSKQTTRGTGAGDYGFRARDDVKKTTKSIQVYLKDLNQSRRDLHNARVQLAALLKRSSRNAQRRAEAAVEKERVRLEEEARRAAVVRHRSNTVLSSMRFSQSELVSFRTFSTSRPLTARVVQVIPEEDDELSEEESVNSVEIRRQQNIERKRCSEGSGSQRGTLAVLTASGLERVIAIRKSNIELSTLQWYC